MPGWRTRHPARVSRRIAGEDGAMFAVGTLGAADLLCSRWDHDCAVQPLQHAREFRRAACTNSDCAQGAPLLGKLRILLCFGACACRCCLTACAVIVRHCLLSCCRCSSSSSSSSSSSAAAGRTCVCRTFVVVRTPRWFCPHDLLFTLCNRKYLVRSRIGRRLPPATVRLRPKQRI